MIDMSPGSPRWRLNMTWGQNWWQQQQNKKKEWQPPDMCTFCRRKIEDGDYFNAGYDRYNIYSETCDHIHCKQWLVHKVRRKK